MDEFDIRLLMECYFAKVSELGELGANPQIIEDEVGKSFTVEEIEIIENELKKDRLKILLPSKGKMVSEFAKEIGDYFKTKKILFFRPFSKDVVRLETFLSEGGEEKTVGFKEMKGIEFLTLAERYMDIGIDDRKWFEKNTSQIRFVKKSMGKEVAESVLESSQFKENLPMIEKVLNFPLPILKDGILSFPKRGYDRTFRSWLSPDSPEIDKTIPLEKAKGIINDILKEFCFKGEIDKTIAIASLLTPFCRGLYCSITSRTPLFVYKANRERCGKDYLAGIRGIIYEGVAMEETPISGSDNTNDDELRKKITSTFIRGKNIFHSSNNKGYLNSAVLEQVITSEVWSDRVLGGNKMCEFPNTMEMSISANIGITYTPDLANRSRICNLFLEIENPNDRRFERPNLHEWIKTHKSEVLSALYSLVRNWVEVGMPSGTIPFASFPEWSRVVGGIMESVGYESPCKVDEDTDIGGDTETKDMKRLFELCYEKWSGIPIVKKQIMDEIETKDSDFGELFSWINWSEEGGRKRFAILFEKFVGRVLSGVYLWGDKNKRSSLRKYTFTRKLDRMEDKDNQTTLKVKENHVEM